MIVRLTIVEQKQVCVRVAFADLIEISNTEMR